MDHQARPLMDSGRGTIEAMGKAHKRADSGTRAPLIVAGNQYAYSSQLLLLAA